MPAFYSLVTLFVHGLSIGSVSASDYTASNAGLMNCKEVGVA